jgi:hypothetical protein
MVRASDFDSIGVSLPREWVNMPVELHAFETMCGELRLRWREAPDWNRTDERQAELLLGRVRSELVHRNVRFAAMFADHGSADGGDDGEALMAVVTFATYTRDELGTTLDLTFQSLLAALAVKPRKNDELRRITNLEPPCRHELRLGRAVRLRRLYELSRSVPGRPTRFYGESFVVPVGDDATTCGVLQFVTTNVRHARPFSDLFVAIANTVTLFAPDDETEIVHLSR